MATVRDTFESTLRSARSTVAFRETINLAFDSFRASKTRFLLTMLGMVIGSASIVLKDPSDTATRAKVEELLRSLAADPANGIERILGAREIAEFGGWPRAAYGIDMKTNFSLVATGPQTQAHPATGTHGYAPSNPQLLASFFIAGPKIKSGVNLGEIDMRSIAATLAQAMGISFPSADLPALPVF